MNQDTTLINESTKEATPTTISWEEAISAAEYNRLYHSLSNNFEWDRQRKWAGLKSLGYSDQYCDKECTPTEFDRDEIMREVAELSRAEQKELKKWNRENRSLMSASQPRKH